MRDEDFYGLALREVTEHQFSQPLMAKAYALALGDPDKTRALYIGMRADQLKAEAVTAIALERERQKRLERERIEAEKLKKKLAAEGKRRQEEVEAQRVGDAWTHGDGIGYHHGTGLQQETPTPGPEQKPQPHKSMTPEELEKTIQSLKEALNPNKSFLG